MKGLTISARFILTIALSLFIAASSSVTLTKAQTQQNTSIYLPEVLSQTPKGLVTQQTYCHFGITAAYPFVPQYNLGEMGVGSYLNWYDSAYSAAPSTMMYVPVIQLFDAAYADIDTSLPQMIAKNPHATWIIGNEPDLDAGWSEKGKHPMSAQTYADRYYHVATYIRANDPDALLAFGTIIQPTPVRIRFLEDVLAQLSIDAGSQENALALIDIFAIHAFQLNEQHIFDDQGHQISWGAGLPIGYDPATWPAPETIDPWATPSETYKTYDINLFKQRITAFRTWMKSIGQQNKPLWVTEYGSVFPPTSDTYETVSDEDTANFMTQTFDYMLSEKNPDLGYPGDDNRLVQQWLWWVLDYDRTKMGGSLWDSALGNYSLVGQKFIDYEPSTDAVPHTTSDPFFVANSLSADVYGYSPSTGKFYYYIDAKVSNTKSVDYRTGVTVDFYDGDVLVGSSHVYIPRCSGMETVSAHYASAVPPSASHTFKAVVRLDADSGTDTNSSNNQAVLGPTVLPDYQSVWLPLLLK